METIQRDFLQYVTEAAGERAALGKVVHADLPRYLTQTYGLFEGTIGDWRFLGIFLRDDADFRPSVFDKHLRQIVRAATGVDGYCLIARDLPSYVRQRLVERRVPFVVPGRQLFWPELGLAVQARKRKSVPLPVEALRPAAQAVVIGALTGTLPARGTPNHLARALGYTNMTMSRAVDEIEANGLSQVERDGRERVLTFPGDRRALWAQSLPYLRSPIQKAVRVKGAGLRAKSLDEAGETALAAWSMLAPPVEPVYATYRRAWKAPSAQVDVVPVQDAGTVRVQLWRYDPRLFARGGRVDRFSLYLSLRGEADERVEAALEEMMESAAWS